MENINNDIALDLNSDSVKKDSEIENIKNLSTDIITDMGFNLLANPDKLNTEIKNVNDDVSENSDSKYAHQKCDSDTDKTTTTTKPTDSLHNLMYDKPIHIGSKYGPAVGAHDGSYQERDDGHSNSHRHGDSDSADTEEENLSKLDMMRKLGELTKNGVVLSQNYTMNSDYKAMKYEYELHKSIRDKHNGVKWLSTTVLHIIYGLELGNKYFDPFSFKLDGWSEQMNQDIDDYYDVFGEIYEKYYKAGKPIPPELKLFFMISGSAIRFHLAQSQMSSIPNIGEFLSKNPGFADNIRQQNQNSGVNENLANQHEAAKNRANDINNLRAMKADQLRKVSAEDELIQKQMEINELQDQLSQLRSDSRSMVSNLSNSNNYRDAEIQRQAQISQHMQKMQQMQQMEQMEQMQQGQTYPQQSGLNHMDKIDETLISDLSSSDSNSPKKRKKPSIKITT